MHDSNRHVASRLGSVFLVFLFAVVGYIVVILSLTETLSLRILLIGAALVLLWQMAGQRRVIPIRDVPLRVIQTQMYLYFGGIAVADGDLDQLDRFVRLLVSDGSPAQVQIAIAALNQLFGPDSPVRWTDEVLRQVLVGHRDRLIGRADKDRSPSPWPRP